MIIARKQIRYTSSLWLIAYEVYIPICTVLVPVTKKKKVSST